MKWFAIPFSSGPCLARIFHHDQSVLDDPTRHSSWFPWIRQGCGPCHQFDKFSVSLIFFLSALWWIRIRGWWKLPDGRDWLRGHLDVVLMGGAILSISLIHLSVDGWVFVPSLLSDLRPNYLGDNEDNTDAFKRPHTCTTTLSILTLQQATVDPHLHWRLMDIHRQVRVCLLWSHCSFLLVPGAGTIFMLVPYKILFPHSCVSSGGSMVGLMVTSSKRAYAIPRSAAPRVPAPAAGHCWPIHPQETLKHSKVGLAQSLWSLLVCTRFCLSPPIISGVNGVWFCQGSVITSVLSCLNKYLKQQMLKILAHYSSQTVCVIVLRKISLI